MVKCNSIKCKVKGCRGYPIGHRPKLTKADKAFFEAVQAGVTLK